MEIGHLLPEGFNMRKVYRFNGNGFDVAWIGKTAPIPSGWHLDTEVAKTGYEGGMIGELENNDIKPIKKRGRPRKE